MNNSTTSTTTKSIVEYYVDRLKNEHDFKLVVDNMFESYNRGSLTAREVNRIFYEAGRITDTIMKDIIRYIGLKYEIESYAISEKYVIVEFIASKASTIKYNLRPLRKLVVFKIINVDYTMRLIWEGTTFYIIPPGVYGTDAVLLSEKKYNELAEMLEINHVVRTTYEPFDALVYQQNRRLEND